MTRWPTSRADGERTAAESGGWFLKLKLADRSELDALLDEDGYRDYVETL